MIEDFLPTDQLLIEVEEEKILPKFFRSNESMKTDRLNQENPQSK